MRLRVLVVDLGHGGTDPGATGNGLLEKTLNLNVGLELIPMLKSRNFDVVMVRVADISLSLQARVALAIQYKADIVISIHHNAFNKTARGIETYCSLFNAESRRLAESVHRELVKAFPELPNRGIKTRRHPSNTGWDYYHMIREPHRQAKIPSIITETGFVDNPTDAAIMKKPDFPERQAEAIAKGVCAYFGVPWSMNLTPIMGPPQATMKQAQEWARISGAHQRFIDIAPIYWKYGQLTGIRPEVMYPQAAHETGYGKYGGIVSPDQNNWAGVKIKNPTGDRLEDHESFATPDDGVRAHYNHMCAYLGLEPIGTPHDRYYVVKGLSWAGTIKYVEELGGRWAPREGYGLSVVSLINSLKDTPYAGENTPPIADAEIEALKKHIIDLEAKIAAAQKALA